MYIFVQMIETQMAVKARQVSELETQTEFLQRTVPEEKMDEIQVKKLQVEQRFEQLKAPLLERQLQLEKKKEAFQVMFLFPTTLLFTFIFLKINDVYLCAVPPRCRG
jgi:hypothetical protein